MKRGVWLVALGVALGLSSCDWLKEKLPTLTVLAVFGEVGPATGPVEQALGVDLPTENLDPSVQTALVYLADENGVVKTAQVSLDGTVLPFQDTVDLYFFPIADTLPVPAPVSIRFGSSRLRIDYEGQALELLVPEGASLQDPVVDPSPVQAGQSFTVSLSFTGAPDSVRLQLSGSGVNVDTVVGDPTSPLTLTFPETLTSSITDTTVLTLTATAFHATMGGDGVTPASMRMVVRSKTAAVPVIP